MPTKGRPIFRRSKTDRVLDAIWLPAMLLVCVAVAVIACAAAR